MSSERDPYAISLALQPRVTHVDQPDRLRTDDELNAQVAAGPGALLTAGRRRTGVAVTREPADT